MPDLEASNGTGNAPPLKRRRTHGSSGGGGEAESATPRDSSPEGDYGTGSPTASTKDAAPRLLSPHRGRPSSRSLSRSASMDDRAKDKHYYSSRSQSRSRSASPSRSRSPRSTSGSRSPSRRRSDSGSRSRSRTPSRSSTTSSRRRHTPLGSSASPTGRGSSPSSPRPRQPLRPNYRPRLELKGHTKPISQVRISPDGRWIASSSADGTARIWDASTGEHMDTLVGHMAGVSCLAWSPDSQTLATGGDDKAIRLWDRVTGSPAYANGADDGSRGRVRRAGTGPRLGGGRKPLLGHHSYVYCLAFSPKGNILASGSYDEAVFLWDVRAGRMMRTLPAHSDPVSGIDICRDGTLVASCSTDGLIRIWDTSTGQCLRTLVYEDTPAVACVRFSPNGRYVLASYLDSCVRMWDFISTPSTVKKTYQGHANKGFSISGCFGQLGGRPFVASASEDGGVVLWDVRSKAVLQRIERAHDGVCFGLDVHGETLVTAGQDGRIVVFRHKPRKAEAEAEAEAAVDGHRSGRRRRRHRRRSRSVEDEEPVRDVEMGDGDEVEMRDGDEVDGDGGQESAEAAIGVEDDDDELCLVPTD